MLSERASNDRKIYAMLFEGFRIVSGGQTGADRAALDWAWRRNIPHGGWCPAGRLAEDGTIPSHYRLQETPSPAYLQRTEWNVRDSDGTVIFSIDARLTGGSQATVDFAVEQKKPWLHLSRNGASADHAPRLLAFIREHNIKVLNVAGPGAAKEPSVYQFVQDTLEQAFVEATRA